MTLPKNPIETAVATCNDAELEKVIRELKTKETNFKISKYIRVHLLTSMMRSNLRKNNSSRKNEERMITSMLKFLTARGVDFCAADKTENTTLLMREARHSLKICKFLVNHGADINAVDGNGNTALYHAIGGEDDCRIVSFLLDSNINYTINLPDIMLQAKGRPDVLKLLLNRCVDAKSESQSGKFILSVLARMKYQRPAQGEELINYVGEINRFVIYPPKHWIKILEYMGCQFMLVERRQLAYVCWRSALTIRISNKCKLPPYAKVEDFDNEILAAPWTYRDFKMSCLYFRVTNELQDYALLSSGIMKLFPGNTFPLCPPFAEHRFYWYVAQCIVGSQWAPTSSEETAKFLSLMITLCVRLLESAKNENEKKITKWSISHLIKINVAGPANIMTALNEALFGIYHVDHDICLELMKLMLQCGSDVHARDVHGKSVLQDYVTRSTSSGKQVRMDVVQLFLAYGAHLDERAHPKQTRIYEEMRTLVDDFCEGKYVTLKCLAARVIADRNIQYVGEVPKELYKFIEIHK